jgi:hypothetical protein
MVTGVSCHQAFGLQIRSDLHLPLAAAPEQSGAAIEVRRLSRAAHKRDGELLRELRNEHGRAVLQVYYGGEAYVWVYPQIGTFVVSQGGSQIEWSAAADKHADAAALISGPVLGFALQLLGRTSLHASVVVHSGKAIAISAPSGYGKSALASALMSRGSRLLADDLAVFEERDGCVWVLPSASRLKLWPDVAHELLASGAEALPSYVSWLDKRVVDAANLGEVCDSPAPLGTVIFLVPSAPETEPAFLRLRGNDGLLALVASTYQAELLGHEKAILARQLQLCSLAAALPIFSLGCPRDLSRLREVADALLRQLCALECEAR